MKIHQLWPIVFLCTSCINTNASVTHIKPTNSPDATINTTITNDTNINSTDNTDTVDTTINNSTPITNLATNIPTKFESHIYTINQSESSVSYGVGEIFLNQNNRYNYAVGTTNIISGEITVNFKQPNLSTVSDISINVQSFQSDKMKRDNAIRDRWLESNKFPIATFTPLKFVDLPNQYKLGEDIIFQIEGNLLVRDAIQPVSFIVNLSIIDNKIIGNAQTKIKITDFGFDPPDIVGILKAENEVDILFDFIALPKDK